MGELNSRPLQCECSALPTELMAHIYLMKYLLFHVEHDLTPINLLTIQLISHNLVPTLPACQNLCPQRESRPGQRRLAASNSPGTRLSLRSDSFLPFDSIFSRKIYIKGLSLLVLYCPQRESNPHLTLPPA